jgi:hypothetical protein
LNLQHVVGTELRLRVGSAIVQRLGGLVTSRGADESEFVELARAV